MSFWNNQAVIYQILIDRFAGFDENARDDKPTWTGGNLRGIIDKLDYIESLGVNVVWLSPFFKTEAYHGYAPTDFYEVDPHFGTKQDLKELMDGFHQRGIKVLLDLVVNHCSYKHEFFQEAINNPDSQYRDWFYFEEYPNKYLSFFEFTSLPKFNLDYRPTRDYMIGVAEYWVREFGFDGFRLDHAPGPSNDFWMEFRDRTRRLNRDSVMIGEIALVDIPDRFLKTIMADSVRAAYLAGEKYDNDQYASLMEEYIGILDGALDFNFFWQMHQFAHDDTTIEKAKKQIIETYTEFPKEFLLPTFLDSHDKNRYLFETGQDMDKLKAAAEFQFSLPQPPIIYYGTEVGMSHDEAIVENSPEPGGDLGARKKMNWQPNAAQQDLRSFYADLINKRVAGDKS